MESDPYHTQELLSNSFDELDKFTFDGLLTKAKIIDVYDGDTVTLVFYFHGIPIKNTFRMYGYDAPEIKPLKTISCRELHVKAAKYVREYLKKKIMGQLVWVKFCSEEKYGRLMGHLYTIKCDDSGCFIGDEENINQLMISKGYGKSYDGGHKTEFTEEELRKILEQESDNNL